MKQDQRLWVGKRQGTKRMASGWKKKNRKLNQPASSRWTILPATHPRLHRLRRNLPVAIKLNQPRQPRLRAGRIRWFENCAQGTRPARHWKRAAGEQKIPLRSLLNRWRTVASRKILPQQILRPERESPSQPDRQALRPPRRLQPWPMQRKQPLENDTESQRAKLERSCSGFRKRPPPRRETCAEPPTAMRWRRLCWPRSNSSRAATSCA